MKVEKYAPIISKKEKRTVIITTILIFVVALQLSFVHTHNIITEKNNYIAELEPYKDDYYQIELVYEELNNSLTSMVGGAEVPLLATPDMEFQEEGMFAFPIAEEDYYLTSPFGARISPLLGIEMKHQGLDIASPTWNAQVVSMADGVVIEHWPAPGTPHPNGGFFVGHPIYGGVVLIEHDNGFQSLYGHLSWSRVMTGQRVLQGEIIGRIGNSGASTGQHLHLEIRFEGEPVNPLLYLNVDKE